MNQNQEILINNMQKHLSLIRQAAGFNQQEFASLIGISRQTLNNIENTRSPLTATQYVAIVSLLDIKIIDKPGLKRVIESILDMDKKQEENINRNIGTTVGAAVGTIAAGGLLGFWISVVKDNK